MSDIRKLLDTINEMATTSGSVASVAQPMGGVKSRKKDSIFYEGSKCTSCGCEPCKCETSESNTVDGTKTPQAPAVSQFGLWKNSALIGQEQRDKKKKKSVKESKKAVPYEGDRAYNTLSSEDEKIARMAHRQKDERLQIDELGNSLMPGGQRKLRLAQETFVDPRASRRHPGAVDVAEGLGKQKYHVAVMGYKRSYDVWVEAKNEDDALIRAQKYVTQEHNDTTKKAEVVGQQDVAEAANAAQQAAIAVNMKKHHDKPEVDEGLVDPWHDKYFGRGEPIKKIFQIKTDDKSYKVKAETEQQAREHLEKHAPGSHIVSVKFIRNIMPGRAVGEGLGKTLKKIGKNLGRASAGWGPDGWGDHMVGSPKDVVDRNRSLSTSTLKKLQADREHDKASSPGHTSPEGLQNKVIDRELKRRDAK